MAIISDQEFILHRQLVLNAMTKQTPRDKWKSMPPVARMLLAAVVAVRYKEHYYALDGYLRCSWRRLALDIFDWDLGMSIRNCAQTHEMLEIKTVVGGHNHNRITVTPQVQQLLDELDALPDQSVVFNPKE
jgi:hypothetical protein